MSTLRLIQLPQSPWSERARWALDHHRLAYEKVDHLPVLGEPKLRRLVGAKNGKPVTVPLLVADGEVLSDSLDIAFYADRNTRNASKDKLIPSELEADVREWNRISNVEMNGLRALVLARALESPQALDDGHPAFTPRWLRPAMRPLARWAVGRLQEKYATRATPDSEHIAHVRAGLDKLRAALEGPYLLGAFTYADIAMATTLQGLVPVADRFFPISPATREVWNTQPDLAREYSDLIAWRDAIYERHRRPA